MRPVSDVDPKLHSARISGCRGRLKDVSLSPSLSLVGGHSDLLVHLYLLDMTGRSGWI
jgi:hypothetical protein